MASPPRRLKSLLVAAGTASCLAAAVAFGAATSYAAAMRHASLPVKSFVAAERTEVVLATRSPTSGRST